MKKVTIYIFIGVALVVAILGFVLFEFKEVPDVSWRQQYLPDSKAPFGTWMFKSLLEERYGAENVLDRYKEIETTDLDSTENHLLVMIGKNLDLDFEETDALANFSNEGNDILIIGENLKFDYDWGLGDYSLGYERDSTLLLTYPDLSEEEYSVKFRRTSFEKAALTSYRYFLSEEEIDTTEEFLDELIDNSDIAESDPEEDDYEEEGYDIEEYEDNGYGVGFTKDSAIVFKQWEFYTEVIQIHTLPYLFTNSAAREPQFLDHFNKTIGYRDYDKIIFEHPSFNSAKRVDSKSPIQFILANRSLKWAYYAMIFGALLYVIFKGKRKQRIVPTLQPNNNTSLEYVQTLGSLYENQNKPRKLVRHMKEIFFHDIKARYFLDVNDTAFAQKLSKKSNIHIDEIDVIVRTFDTIKTRYDFTDVDLSILYRRLDAFYKNCK